MTSEQLRAAIVELRPQWKGRLRVNRAPKESPHLRSVTLLKTATVWWADLNADDVAREAAGVVDEIDDCIRQGN